MEKLRWVMWIVQINHIYRVANVVANYLPGNAHNFRFGSMLSLRWKWSLKNGCCLISFGSHNWEELFNYFTVICSKKLSTLLFIEFQFDNKFLYFFLKKLTESNQFSKNTQKFYPPRIVKLLTRPPLQLIWQAFSIACVSICTSWCFCKYRVSGHVFYRVCLVKLCSCWIDCL